METTKTAPNEDLPESVDQPKKRRKSSHGRQSVLDFRKYTKQIWLAGLGAFSRAEEEGNKLFDSLVKVGEELEYKSTEIADQTVEKISEKAKESVAETKDKVEKILDQGVNQPLNRIGLVTSKDFQQLEHLVLQLHQKLDLVLEQQEQILQQHHKK